MMKRLNPSSKGVYVLLLSKECSGRIRFGRNSESDFPAGWYGYVGSAMGGLAGRLRHHCGISNRPHWHIDRLRPYVTIAGIVCGITEKRIECDISCDLIQTLTPVSGFGSTDCGCHSHLYYHIKRKKIEEAVLSAFKNKGTQVFTVQCCDIVSYV